MKRFILLCLSIILACVSARMTPTNITDLSRFSRRQRLLITNPDWTLRTPKKRQMNPKDLFPILGPFFDPQWMSVEKPKILVVNQLDVDASPQSKLRTDFKKLNFTAVLPEDNITALEEWFLKKVSCPVQFTWHDVGPLFWPRWIRRGNCFNDPNVPCSWPPGMQCVPAESSTIQVLRWVCTRRRSTDGTFSHKCQWIRVPYPVTAECFCSC
uniref:Noggin n=1 Tax=Strigamia maritima TaxID=126957 RepID=T1JNT9_STRMM